MPHKEQTNNRPTEYSQWHRVESIMRFMPGAHEKERRECAVQLGLVDTDAIIYMECTEARWEPLALIEVAKDSGQKNKCALAITNLAQRADIPGYVVLYSLDGRTQIPGTNVIDICGFRVKQVAPERWLNWQTMTPAEYANMLLEMRNSENLRRLGI